MKFQRILIFLVFFVLFLGAADYVKSDSLSSQFFQDDAKLPKSFRISPAKASIYAPRKVLYNPVEDIYVAFTMEFDVKVPEFRVYSRAYNYKGKPKGPFFKLLPMRFPRVLDEAPAKYYIVWVDICYNSTDNKFVIIWTYNDYDGISGMELNARGNREGVETYSFNMKKRLNKPGTGFSPMIGWDSNKNQYLMGWTYVTGSKTNPKNGYYLSTFTSFLTPKKSMKKVRSMRILNYIPILNEFIVAGGKLFWGSVEEIDKNFSQPVAWMTKMNGKNLSPEMALDAGAKYPGKKIRYGGDVSAGYDSTNNVFLLTWNSYDEGISYNRTYQQNHYRIMDGNGNFIGKEQIVPQVENFQSRAFVTYDQNDDHFFLVCAEYKVLAESNFAAPSPQFDNKNLWGGKLWGYKIDGQGKQIGSSIPLTKVFTDSNAALGFTGAYYNASDDQHFILYAVTNNSTQTAKAFGLIYK